MKINKGKIKYWITVILVALGLGSGAYFGNIERSPEALPKLSKTSDERKVEVVAEQLVEFQTTGKYKQYKEQETTDGTIEVHEYVGPQGAGFVIIRTKTDKDGNVWKKIENNGPETEREKDWHIFNPDIEVTPPVEKTPHQETPEERAEREELEIENQ